MIVTQRQHKYIMETMGGGTTNYERLVYIDMGLPCETPFREIARHEAEERGLAFEVLEGNMTLLRKLIEGEWDED